jgi:hypothetical protein
MYGCFNYGRFNYGRFNYGRFNYGRFNYGRFNYGRFNYGRFNYGRFNYGRWWKASPHQNRQEEHLAEHRVQGSIPASEIQTSPARLWGRLGGIE